MTTQNRNEIENNNRIIATSSSFPNNGAAVALPGSTAFEDEDTNCRPFNSWISRYLVLERKLRMLNLILDISQLKVTRTNRRDFHWVRGWIIRRKYVGQF